MKSGFTLLELLIVIAVLGLLAGIVLIAINPVEQLARTRDSNKKSDITSLGKAIEAYAVLNSKYPNATSTWGRTLINSGELKNLPTNNDPTVCANGFNQNGYCYKKDNNENAIIYTSLVSTLDTSQCGLSEGVFYAYSTKEGKASIVCTIGLTSEPNPDGGNFVSVNPNRVKQFAASLESRLRASLVGKWSFEGNANDTSGSGNNGTLIGGASITASCQNLGFSQCLSLDGSTGYIDLPQNSQFDSIGAGSFTMAAWVNLQEPMQAHNRFLVLEKSCGGTRLVSLMFLNSQKFAFGLSHGDETGVTGSSGSITTGDTYNYGEWHFVVGTRDSSGNIKLYINGVVKGQAISTLDLGNSLACNRIGKLGDEYTKGLIDEVAIYNQPLISSQIQHLYASGLIRHILASR